MTWAKMAAKGIPASPLATVFKIPVSWHCNLQTENKDLIENYATEIARQRQFKKCFVRAGVHSTKTSMLHGGQKRILYNQPPHFTLEFETMQGRCQNMHVYTQTEMVVDDNGDKREYTKGIMPVSTAIPENPEVFVAQGRSSHKEHLQNNVSTGSFAKVSKGRVLKM